MHYLVINCPEQSRQKIKNQALSTFADGSFLPIENTWSTAPLSLARVADGVSLDEIRGFFASVDADVNVYAAEGQNEPGDGQAILVGGHTMLDGVAFKPYADSVVAVAESFKGRFLARGGKVTPIAGKFAPDRPVILQFPTAVDAAAFYVSEIYAPLLDLRFKTTIPRLVLLAKSGPVPPEAVAMLKAYSPPSAYPVA